MNTNNIFQRPRAAAEISPVNECRQIKVEFDPTCKVSMLCSSLVFYLFIFIVYLK